MYDIYTPKYFRESDIPLAQINGKWTPARPLPYRGIWNRLKLTWLVLTYKADVLKWHKQ